jgi:hypothetical protein
VSSTLVESISQPPTEPREALIKTATTFLSSPDVRKADDNKKIQFLTNKGLTRKEIEVAMERVANMVRIHSMTSISCGRARLTLYFGR